MIFKALLLKTQSGATIKNSPHRKRLRKCIDSLIMPNRMVLAVRKDHSFIAPFKLENGFELTIQ